MSNKYKIPKNELITVNEPAAVYETTLVEATSFDTWNPNVPFHGTQEEWWEHFHHVEKGPFFSVSEVHQRISQWLDNQEK